MMSMRESEPQHFWQPGPCLGFAVQMSNLNFPPPCVERLSCPDGLFWNTAASLWPEILSWFWEDIPCSQYFPLVLSWHCWSWWAVLTRQDLVAENIPSFHSCCPHQDHKTRMIILKNCFGSDPKFQQFLNFPQNRNPAPDWMGHPVSLCVF